MRTAPPARLPVMSAEDMADAGLDQDEAVTMLSLPDRAERDGFDAARRAMSGKQPRDTSFEGSCEVLFDQNLASVNRPMKLP